MNKDAKIFSKIQIQEPIKKIIHYDQMGFIPEREGWVIIHTSINTTHHINRFMYRNHIIISIGANRAFDEVQHAFMIQVPKMKSRWHTPQNSKCSRSQHYIKWNKPGAFP